LKTMKAVVVNAIKEYSVEEVTLDPPKAGELLVKMKATGVCRSDLSVINGTIPMQTPIVIGHEGAGIVEEVGEGVTQFEIGDHVVLSFVPFCGECNDCHNHRHNMCTAGSAAQGKMIDGTTRVHRGDEDLQVMTLLGCMAEYVVCPSISAVKIAKDIPLDKAALVGCGVMTGVGAAINTAKVEPGSSVAVFGCGGIGLSIIQGARLAGAGQIIAVDLSDNKLEMAAKFGATHLVNGGVDDAVAKVQELTGGGADYAFEAVGVPALMEQAYNAVRRAGTAVVVGVGKVTDSMQLNALMISLSGKTLKGSMYGDANPPVDFPKLLNLYQDGKLNLDDMVSNTYSIDEVKKAFDDMEDNVNARGVIVFD
jgi:S-(hydroxymethyl)glutathione dehydrogenase/alcohol dehydrogenase